MANPQQARSSTGLLLKTLLLAGLALFFVWEIFPVERQIRLGKDLRGGVSLVYSVRVPEGASGEEVIAQVIDVLKQRVNPQGVLDISMEPQGSDRIEVVMPLPNPAVRELQVAFRDRLQALLDCTNLRPSQLDAALRQGTLATRHACVADAASLERVQSRFDAVIEARAALEQAMLAGGEEAALGPFQDRVVDAELAFEQLRSMLLRPLTEARLLRVLALEKVGKPLVADDGTRVLDSAGQPVREASLRELAIADLKAEHPGQEERIDAVVAAWDAYDSERTGLDDPEDLKRLLRGAGVLEFRIAVDPTRPEEVNLDLMREQLRERGPRNTDSPVARWFEIHDLKQWYETDEQLASLQADPAAFFAGRRLVAAERDGRYFLLLYVTEPKSMTHGGERPWSIKSAGRTRDELGRAAVAFAMDPNGATLLGRLTAPHIGEPMAIVLDDKVYGAPTLQSRIAANGQITGNYGEEEIRYLIRVLAAGALEARLSPEPIAVSVLGPSIGRENLVIGLEAVALSIIAVAAIMVGYYFLAGVVAVVALVFNAIIIFGFMAMIDGTFTLPGLAGIALTVGMAVDANVLIYERLREEIVNHGERLRDAIRIAYRKASSAILDGNITNLIVCFVLYQTAATEVKGFALTLSIGVLATLFTTLVMTRTAFDLYTEVLGAKRLPMLATVFPSIHRLLEPSIDWVRWRPFTIGGAAVLSIASIAILVSTGRDMLETEFRGGVSLTMSTRAEGDGRLLLPRAEVERRLQEIGERTADADSPLAQLRSAKVLTVGETTPEFEASSFTVKVPNPPRAGDDDAITPTIVAAVVEAFGDELDVVRPVAFTGSGGGGHADRTFPVERTALADVLRRPAPERSVEEFRGGVAILVEDIEPPLTTEDARARIDRMRTQPDFTAAAGRAMEIVGLDPADPARPEAGYRSLAVLVADPEVDSMQVEFDTWDRELARIEWELVEAAFTRPPSLDQVSSFSPRVAENLAASAVVAVILSLMGMLVYIWARFGSLRYSAAAVAALCVNVCLCLGALALSLVVAPTVLGLNLRIEEFRIDLNVVAGLLAIIGYSLNDTIVILDRVRENRGKLSYANRAAVNLAINQTFSRTILTSGTTIVTALILYWLGGTGIRPFAFTFLVGLVVATCSSVAVAAPMVWSRRESGGTRPADDAAADRDGAGDLAVA